MGSKSKMAKEVTCDNCGLCCMHMIAPCFLPEAEKAVRPELLAMIRLFRDSPRHDNQDRPCIWLDLVTGKCRHYEHRPEVCREFEAGGSGCLAARKAFGIDDMETTSGSEDQH